MNSDSFFTLGIKLASTLAGQTPKEFSVLDSFVSHIEDKRDINYGNLQRFVCKVAADAFAEAGRKDDIAYHLFDKLASTPVWYSELSTFSDVALCAIGKVSMGIARKEAATHEEHSIKGANSLLPSLLAGAGKSTPDVVKTVGGVGAVGGGIAGALYWLLNRDSNEDEDEAEVIKAKIDYYNKISDEIKSGLRDRVPQPTRGAARRTRPPVSAAPQNII